MKYHFIHLGETRKAIEYYEQQLKINQKIGDRRGEGNALWNTSLTLDGLGRREEAVKMAKEALAIYEQIESPVAERVRRKLVEWQRSKSIVSRGSFLQEEPPADRQRLSFALPADQRTATHLDDQCLHRR